MADIFVSYTSSDKEWAQWIALELEKLGHLAHVHEWEIKGGEDIYAWMDRRGSVVPVTWFRWTVHSTRRRSEPASPQTRGAAIECTVTATGRGGGFAGL